MTHAFRLSLPLVVAAALALAGCGHSGDSGHSGLAVPPTPSSAVAASVASASSVATPPGYHVNTRRYRIDITYPRLPASEAVLSKALHQTAAKARHEFIQALPNPKKHPELANRQFQLMLKFSMAARMPAFVSVRERGMAATGGAHPIPIDATFVYDTQAGKIITLGDLFSDPDAARERLSKVARKALDKTLLSQVPGGTHTTARARKEWTTNMRKMIRQGTQPTEQDYSEFVVLAGAGDKASGLLLVFPPYQVAPGVYGSQTVEVPVGQFAKLLKPEYQGDFDTGE